jgi:hypothetical protein
MDTTRLSRWPRLEREARIKLEDHTKKCAGSEATDGHRPNYGQQVIPNSVNTSHNVPHFFHLKYLI